ncbi:hypothetical protein EJ08DRAFT_579761 [Tothia fuscella]|uniref:GYF domain-containing protein n=1 Tax=Tothia fuscella TaxID=1048955 RepID=A0A9P4P0D4_9PEZI|nr:hypothetical protein EJ08DRAFT_579761 [Tothia fuscella]
MDFRKSGKFAHSKSSSRRQNGATQTFRRPSTATNMPPSAHQRDGSATQPRTSTDSTGVYVPPHLNAARNGTATEQRYSKDQLLQLYNDHHDSEDAPQKPLSSLFYNGWEPNITNGNSSTSWGRRDDHKDSHGADLCWDRDANMHPMALNEMTEEEKDLFTSSVNSPLKPPTQSTNKDGTPKDTANHRKSSISQSLNSPGGYGLSSPTSARPGGRRRDTSDAYPFPPTSLASPATASRFNRDDTNTNTPPPALLRRRTDLKDSVSGPGSEERDKDKSRTTDPAPLGGLKRSITAGSGAPFSQAAGFSPMGTFGSFSLGTGAGQSSAPAEKKSGYGSVRGESRFKGLMAREGVEDTSKNVKEKGSMSSLGRLDEADQDKGIQSWMRARSNRPTSEDSDPFPSDEYRTGSAALGGGYDSSPAQQRGFSNDDSAFSAFGMTTDTVGLRSLDDYTHQTPHRNEGTHEPMSPTDTNPFQSPDNDRNGSDDAETDGSDIQHSLLPGLGGFVSSQASQPSHSGLPGLGGFGRMARGTAPFEGPSDRSQTSSTGPGRGGFASFSGLGTLPGLGGPSPWSAGPGVGTPTRERSGFGGAFGEGIFSSGADLQSPVGGLAGLGGSSAFGAAPGSGFGATGTLGRGSRMGSLFPTAMQDQMRTGESAGVGADDGAFDAFGSQPSGFGALGRGTLGAGTLGAVGGSRDTESPFHASRGIFDDLIGGTSRDDVPASYADSPFTSTNPIGSSQHNLSSFPSQETIGVQRNSQPSLQRQSSGILSPGGSQPPVSQVRTMVMPDRMKWIYKDPQNKTQGPWSGLEMHDWYKAGFFTPELLIKKLEDPEFEPLAQLIRRIGNSREPFLVPQIGVSHEPSTNPARTLAAPTSGASSAQPPFASSFPSFGTTLTAEQQNALERRKQEEQYLMARQKEHLAQQQLIIKQMQISGGGHGIGSLHHHSSAHSLHSQPSFGSITSPSGYQPSPTQGPIAAGQPVPGFFDNSFRAAPGAGMGSTSGGIDMLGNIRENEISGMLERMNLNRGPQAIGGQAPLGSSQSGDTHSQQVAAMLNDRARLQREQSEHDLLQQRTNQGDFDHMGSDRLQQFQALRVQTDLEQDTPRSHREEYHALEQANCEAAQMLDQMQREMRGRPSASESDDAGDETPSLTQQVQAASAKKQASAQQTLWTKVDLSLMEQMQRPPQSASPMPAPVAQRKQNVAEDLIADSRSRTQSPSVETPGATLAPWANKSEEAPKGPSLKEIQEAEAKKAAKQEELAAAHRRIVLEKEFAQAQAAATTAPAPGLASSSNWASTQSPAGSTSSAPSVWAKPNSMSSGKTLQQIQKEEEDRKRRVAAASASAVSALGNVVAPSKRYAEITGKASPASPAAPNSPWTTVGASGKVKALATPTGAPVRSVSGNIPNVQTPKATTRSTTMGGSSMAKLGKADAIDEFKKWAVGDLQRGQLNPGVEVNSFVEVLLVLGTDVEILTEAVHGASQTIDSRHFAEEFIRRKKQADKGVFEPSSTSSPSTGKPGNDWSAVAKKGPPAVVTPGQEPFKIAKRKGGRK